MRRLANRRLGEECYLDEPVGGPVLCVIPRSGHHRRFASVTVRYGSVDNRFVPPGSTAPVEVPAGIAHFLEHKLFEDEAGNVFDRFAALGASANAYTSHTHTSYHFTTTGDFPAAYALLLEFVQRPYFTPETVKKEQGIIEQEIKMYLDDPQWRVYQNLLEALFQEYPVRLDIAGTVESVRRIRVEDLYLCYRAFYRPAQTVVCVSGDVDPAEVAQLTSRLMPPGAAEAEVRRLYPEEPPGVAFPRREEAMAVAEPVLYLGFKEGSTGERGEPLLRRELATQLLLDTLVGRASPLFSRLYEEGLIDDRFGASYLGEIFYGASILGGETPQPDRLEEELRRGIAAARSAGVDRAAFERGRRKLMGEALRSFNSPQAAARAFGSGYLRGIGPYDYLEALDALGLEDLEKRLAEHFREDNLAVSVVRPREPAKDR